MVRNEELMNVHNHRCIIHTTNYKKKKRNHFFFVMSNLLSASSCLKVREYRENLPSCSEVSIICILLLNWSNDINTIIRRNEIIRTLQSFVFVESDINSIVMFVNKRSGYIMTTVIIYKNRIR